MVLDDRMCHLLYVTNETLVVLTIGEVRGYSPNIVFLVQVRPSVEVKRVNCIIVCL